jgi:FMN-dependent NADH-azoreductase
MLGLSTQRAAVAEYRTARQRDYGRLSATSCAKRLEESCRRKEVGIRILNIITSPRRERSASIAIVKSFLAVYKQRTEVLEVDTLDVWTESLPEFDSEAIGAKYKGVLGEPISPSESMTWEKIRELASRFQKADRIVLGVPMWNFSFPYKLKQLIDLACQRNMLFTFDRNEYGPALNIDKAFVVYVRGQSERASFRTDPPPGFEYVTKYLEFWLHFIGVRSITAMSVEHTWDSRALDTIDQAMKQAAELARQF